MGDPPDAAMIVIATRIAKVMLSVVNDRVVPVSHIHGSVRTDLHIDRTKVRMPGADQRLEHIRAEAGTVLNEFISNDGAALKTPRQQLAPNVISDVSASRQIAAALFLRTDERFDPNRFSAVPRRRREIHDAGVVHHEGLSPAIEDMSPGIAASPAAEHPQLERARIELINSAVEIPHDAVLRFDLRVQEDSFLKVDPATRATTPGADGMVTVLNTETRQHQFLHIRNIVTVGVLQEEDVGRLRDITTAVGQFDARWQIQPSAKTVDLSATPSSSVSSRMMILSLATSPGLS